VAIQDAIRRGWLRVELACPSFQSYAELNLARLEDVGGPNLFCDNGRQCLAYVFGGRSPSSDFACKKFGLGVGTTPPNVADVGLESALNFFGGSPVKPVDSISYPAPFIAAVQFTIGATEANGFLITEMGLFSGNDTLISRRVMVGINKTSDFAPTLSWRIRL
jgi:hypothetical protein